jgi:hypothetical protein
VAELADLPIGRTGLPTGRQAREIMYYVCAIESVIKNYIYHARVAELADALDLGSSGEIRRGSTPLSRTI